jgi:hypothetical protein
VCLNATATFTLTNSGGSTLQWTTTSTANYGISPQNDSLASGAHEAITVHNISGGGTLTFTDPRAANSPQRVTISCTL